MAQVRREHFRLSALLLIILCIGLCAQANAQGEQPQTVEIKMIARQFDFAPKTITVRKGQRVKLSVTSEDVDHGIAIDEFNIDERVKANKTQVIEFTPTRTGRFKFYCSIFCGEGHPKMVGELIVTEDESPGSAAESKMKVTFDESTPGVVIVESAGERIRIDTSTKTVTRLGEPTPTAPQESVAAGAHREGHAAASTEQREVPVVREPYDYRLVNLPTPKRVKKHSLNMYFTHRFSEPVRPVEKSVKNVLGLDSFSVSSLGLFYGITDRLYVSAYRSPLCQTGLCKTIELGVGYHWLDEAGRSPVALATYASVEGDDNFTEQYTFNIQAQLARSVTRHVNLFFAPAVHINSNGQGRFNPRPENFFPPEPRAAQFDIGQHTASFGFGVNARIRPSVSLLFEYVPSVGFKMGRVSPIFDRNFNITGFKNESEAALGFGIEKDVGRHAFSLTFSNTQGTTTSRYNSSNLVLPPQKFTIGFNLYRRLL